MKTIKGKFAKAKVLTTNNPETALDQYSEAQIQMICDNEVSLGSKISVMPDVHAGKVGPIGLTMTIKDRIMPSLVGVDIGCGMYITEIKAKRIDFQKLDKVIREHVPSGFNIRQKPHRYADDFEINIDNYFDENKARLSLGTLGGGNHFIEIDKDDDGKFYMVIHTGSRHLGVEITEHWLKEGQKALKAKGIEVPYELTYLEDNLKMWYLYDVKVACEYANHNRILILDSIAKHMKWDLGESYECRHNYVDMSSDTIKAFGAPMLRKGAISAKLGEKVIIPINMRDGVILGRGLGNKSYWNMSAPHGSGRLYKRSDVKNHYTVSAFKKDMAGIYSTCIDKYTLDEAPFAYRPIDEIAEAIKGTVVIDKIIKPVYSFKAGNNLGLTKI